MAVHSQKGTSSTKSKRQGRATAIYKAKTIESKESGWHRVYVSKPNPIKSKARAIYIRNVDPEDSTSFVYSRLLGVDEFVDRVSRATPMQIVTIERNGVVGTLIKDLSQKMKISSKRMFTILGVPKATAEKKAASGEKLTGSGGQAAIGMVKLLGIAKEIVSNSTAAEAKDFDTAKWLGEWIERPQPSLGGRKPTDMLDTPTGVEIVARLLGSIASGSYQ